MSTQVRIRVAYVKPIEDWRNPPQNETTITLAMNERVIGADHTGHRGEIAVYIEVAEVSS